MRLALIINSAYSGNNVVLPRAVFEDTGTLLESRLPRLDTGFDVASLKATRDLPEQLDQILESRSGSLEELLIHYCGYLAVKPDRGLALLLDGTRPRAFPISRLRAAAAQAADRALVIMDVVAVADGPVDLDEIANNLGIALNATTPHIAALSSVAEPDDSEVRRRGCLRLTDLWLLSLEYQARQSHGKPVYLSRIVRGIEAETMAFASLPSFAYQPCEQDFLALPAAPARSALASAPPHVARLRHVVPDNSAQQPSASDDLDAEEERTNPPAFGKRPSLLDLPLPLPPPVRASQPAVAPPAPGPAWIDESSYYPSAPPPTVQPKLSVPPPLQSKISVPPPMAQVPASSTPRIDGQPMPQPGTLEDAAGARSDAATHFEPIEPGDDYGDTVGLLESTLMRDPRHLPTLRALSDAAQRQRDVDTAALASAVLVCLQAARPEDEVRLGIIVTDGLPMARRTLNDRDFDDALLANRDDRLLFETLARLTQASIAGGLAFKAGYEELPKDAAVLDPESSTVTLGRSLGWVGKFLSINTPELVVLSELPAHMLLTLNGKERLLISRQLGSGLSLAQLAFLGARHLTMLRPEFKWRAALDSSARLSTVIGHCVRFCHEGPDFVRNLEDAERKGAKRFWAQVEEDPSLVEQVGHLFGAVEFDRKRWEELARQILVTADRVLIRGGLLACANPAAAWQLTQQYPLDSLLSIDEQLDEVARFATSRNHMMLRRSLGLTVSRA